MQPTVLCTLVAICVVLTLRDLKGKNGQQVQAKETLKLKEHTLFPTLQFVYWYDDGYRRVYEELAQVVQQKFPALKVEGDIYPPPAWRNTLAKTLQLIKFGLILCVVLGLDPFSLAGLPTPNLMVYASQNKVSFCLMLFLIGNLVEGQLLSTGAFEIYLNDVPIWSKLDSSRFPQPRELLQIIENQLNFAPQRNQYQ